MINTFNAVFYIPNGVAQSVTPRRHLNLSRVALARFIEYYKQTYGSVSYDIVEV